MISNPSILEEYHRMSSSDRATFRRWLTFNTVIGAVIVTLIAMIAINVMFWGGEFKPENPAKQSEAIHQVEQK